MCSWPSAAAQIQENPFEPDGRLQRREVPDRLWITKITYLIVGTNKLQRILPRTLPFTDLNQYLIQLHLHFPTAVNT